MRIASDLKVGRSSRRAMILLAVSAVLLSGCVSKLLTSPPPATYDLTGLEQTPKLRGSISAQILVPEPGALKILNSEHIVVANGPIVAYYPNAQYPDSLPRMVQTRVIEAFEKTKRAKAVGKPGDGLSIDYQLLTDIRKFDFNVTTGGRFAEIEIAARLLNDHNGRVVASRTFTASVPVGQDNAASAVSGLNAGLDQILADMMNWTAGKV
jgi:cholesterol transport system auxiliary component